MLGITGTLVRYRHDALYPFKSGFQDGCGGKVGSNCYNPATPCTKTQQFESKM